MTLIKFNIENKTKDQRKKEVLNKLRKIQSMVQSDANYTEMVYHIITNASLQKKNMKVNLDHYGNYTVIDAKNKIVSGGMFNSNGGNASVQTPNNKVNTHIITSQPSTTSMNQRKNMNPEKNNLINNKPTAVHTISSETTADVTTQNNSSLPTTSTLPVRTADTTEGLDNNPNQIEKPGFFSSMVNTLTGKNDTDTQKKTEQTGTEGSVEKVSEPIGTKGTGKSNKIQTATEGEAEPLGTKDIVTESSGQLDTEGTRTKGDAGKVSGKEGTEEAKEPEKKTGLFGLWGGKNKSIDNDSFPSFHTTVFNDGSEEIFMEHMKNMSSKKYLRSLTTQELKDIMKSNHMKVTHNGSYYNKEQMVNKVYQFYK